MTFQEISNFFIEIFKANSEEAVNQFKQLSKEQNKKYKNLSYKDKCNTAIVASITDEVEKGLVSLLNEGLSNLNKSDSYKFVWSNTVHNNDFLVDRKDGDIYLWSKEADTYTDFFDLKTASEKDYDCRYGKYLGGQIGEKSMKDFPKENHYYLLSTYDGNIISLWDSSSIQQKLTENKILPRPSNFDNNEPYYTIIQHLKDIGESGKDVCVIRNLNNSSIGCFKK